MYLEIIEKVGNAGVGKSNFLKISPGKYFMLSILAGFFVGLGILLIFTIGGLASSSIGLLGTKVLMGVSFGIALSLVIMAGSELFTGNNLVMMISVLEKKVSWIDTINLWIVCYLGNFLGSIICGYLFYATSLAPLTGDVGKFIVTTAVAKSTAPFMNLFVRGILCNIFVCLAVWCSSKMTSESGKLIMIWWCLFGFITIGLEHSIANMTLFSTLIFEKSEFIGAMVRNLLPVTLGNIVGGCGLGAVYYYVGKVKE